MQATLTEQQELIVESVGRMTDGGISKAQGVLQGGSWPNDPDSALLQDWVGLGVPESMQGAGGGLLDLALVLKTLALRIVPNKFSQHVIAVQVAMTAGLPVADALSGNSRWCLAVAEQKAEPFGPFHGKVDGEKITADKNGVPQGADADLAVVVLDNDLVALAEASSIDLASSTDPLNPCASLSFKAATSIGVARGARKGLMRATALMAADLCGVAQGAIDVGASYAKERVQFGKPIGTYQGVAHQLASAVVAAETAWSLTLYACWALDNNSNDAEKAVHAAKAKASEAAVFSAERALQVHGGMGMTWEASPHLFLRRALAGSAFLGGAHWHRCIVGKQLLKQHNET